MELKSTRRIVTGHDANGKAVALIDAPQQAVQRSPGGNAITMLWVTDETQGLIYKITLADYVSETDAVGLAGNGEAILHYRHVVGSKIHLTFNNTSTLYDTIQVLRSSSANGRYSLIGSVSGGTGLLSFDDTNVKLSTSYFYKIRSTVFNAYLGGPLEITDYYNAPF